MVGEATDGAEGYERELRARVHTAGLDSRVRFTGFVADTGPVYAMLDLLVHSSIDPEPFGLAITEAMGHGVAVVASDRGAPREIITEGVDGLLRDPADTAAVAEAIIALLGDPVRRGAMGERSRTMVRERYDPALFAQSVQAVWREALSGEGRASA